MFQLSFNQKVGFGFAVIILLLLTSGLSSLWTLNDIDGSTSLVNETAVPVVKESNDVQIQLLKLAKLSSLAFNAVNKKQIEEYRKEFDEGAEQFSKRYQSLQSRASKDSDMQALVIGIKSNYDLYRYAVIEMFEAKLEVLAARERMIAEADTLLGLLDNVGAALVEIQYYVAPEEYKDQMKLVTGFAEQSDTLMLGVLKTIEEIKITTDAGRLGSGMDEFRFPFAESKRWFDKGAEIFRVFDDEGLLEPAFTAYDALSRQLDASPSIVDHKLRQLQQSVVAINKLGEADAAVSQSIDGLDELLKSADDQFSVLQNEVFGNLDFGFKSSVVMLVVLILLAAQNFNSMRTAIQKKMEDLAKLNIIGRSLAGAQNQNAALEEVLQSMHEKICVDQGSVYLTNDRQQLEVRACFPPRAIEVGAQAAKFDLGQGVIGKAAETKKVIFVPDTAKDKSFVSQENAVGKALLCVPLVDKDMLVGVINLSGSVKKVSFADSDYEFVSSVARSLVTTIKNIRMREVIEEQNRNLEAKVEERTAELRQKNDDIANMMANMHQGLFTITLGGLIHPEYASYLEEIFETDRIADRNFSDLLFSNTAAGADAVDQNITAVDAIVGEDEMMYDFNSHCLMKEMVIKFDEGREKILELDWDPIITDGQVNKLMVTIRDVTELKALEREAEGQKRELTIIGEILAVDAAKFGDFIKASQEFLAKCRALIETNTEKDVGVISELFRNMHTIKGNARTYGLKYITDVVHAVESSYDDLRKYDEVLWDQERLLAELTGAEQIIGHYAHVFRDKLGRDSEAAKSVSLDPNRLALWLASIRGLTRTDMTSSVKGVVSEAYNMLVSISAKPLSAVISDVLISANSLADQLGKARPNIEIDNGDIFIEGEAHSTLNNIFMHVFRNAMDHGIESIDERFQKGKSVQGTIKVVVTHEADGFATLAVRDDGRGIAITKIYEMAIKKGIYDIGTPRPSAIDIANLIFASGFSTAEQVTDVSGRGVGMDAVKNFLEKSGGGISVALDEGKETDDFRTFTTLIRIPEKFYKVSMDFARTA